jgi:uncharacterized protein (UPF0276 family)
VPTVITALRKAAARVAAVVKVAATPPSDVEPRRSSPSGLPCGVGIGLRRAFARELFAEPPAGLAFVEIHPENYLERGGVYQRILDEARARFPIITHGLTCGVAQADSYAPARLKSLSRFVRDVGAVLHSDHLCFASVDGVYAHDLLPVPRNAESVRCCARRIAELSDALGQAMAIEHISFYIEPPASELSEQAFIAAVLDESCASLLLDVNNVYVNAKNQGFDPYAFIAGLPLQRVSQLHMAGHAMEADGLRIDTHAAPICEEVFALYRFTLERLGRPVPVLLERDDNFPAYPVLEAEVARLIAIYDDVQNARAVLA